MSVAGFRAGAIDTFTYTFPGRFSVLLGANNAGKTTVCDALYLAHPHRFPQLPRPSAAALGDAPRVIEVGFEFEKDDVEGPLGRSLLVQSQPPPSWSRSLERSLGSVRAVNIDNGQHVDSTRLVYLPAHRNIVARYSEPCWELTRQLGQSRACSIRTRPRLAGSTRKLRWSEFSLAMETDAG